MLNKPFPNSELLRVHRHTIPPCISLSSLVDRYLPNGKGSVGIGSKEPGAKKQDLRRFARALRKEVVGYHNRISVIKSLRKEFKLDEKVSRKGKGRERVIADISAADAEAKQMRIEWVDGRIGRCVVGEGGEVRKCVVIGEEGRDFETERRVVKGGMEGIGERLREGIYWCFSVVCGWKVFGVRCRLVDTLKNCICFFPTLPHLRWKTECTALAMDSQLVDVP
jgi:central kinetochore subunit Mal2/MCM21